MRRYWNRSLDGGSKEITVRKKKKRKKTSHSVWSKFLSLRRKLIRSIAVIRLQIVRLNERIHALQEQVNGLQGGASPGASPGSSVSAFLRGRLNSRITVETTAGTIFGTLIAIGEDNVQIAEPNGSIVIIPLRSFLSIA
ncbi:hypothetical protein ACFW1P_03620 [Paenibacillus sp. NPDC058910]|uniref:hypothetical protein n=1 Tax=unclassified Paenibacillus TaxID=185978 RepID=UPI0036B5C1DC